MDTFSLALTFYIGCVLKLPTCQALPSKLHHLKEGNLQKKEKGKECKVFVDLKRIYLKG